MMCHWKLLYLPLLYAVLLGEASTSCVRTTSFERLSSIDTFSAQCAAECSLDHRCTGYTQGTKCRLLHEGNVQNICKLSPNLGCHRKLKKRATYVELLLRSFDNDSEVWMCFTHSKKCRLYTVSDNTAICEDRWQALANRSDVFVDVTDPVNDIYQVKSEPCPHYYVIYGSSVEVHRHKVETDGSCSSAIVRIGERRSILKEYGVDVVVHAATQNLPGKTTILISGDTMLQLETFGQAPNMSYQISGMVRADVMGQQVPHYIQAIEILAFDVGFHVVAVDEADDLWGYDNLTATWKVHCRLNSVNETCLP